MDVPFNKTCWLAAHNAFANTSDGWVYAQQHLSMQKQFEYGVRCFLVDFHWYDQKACACAPWGKKQKSYLALMHGASSALNAVQHPRKPKRVAMLLDMVRTWLLRDTDAIITLIVEDYGGDHGYDALVRMLAMRGLTELCYVNKSTEREMMTLKKMIARNKRLVIITSHTSDKVRTSKYIMSTSVLRENHWEWNRGHKVRRATGKLALFNHFKSFSSDVVHNYEDINSRKHLRKRLGIFVDVMGAQPNFVALDYVEQGDGLRIVKEIVSANH